MKTYTLLLLLTFSFAGFSQAPQYKHSKHAISANYDIFLFDGYPYLTSLSIQGLKYNYILGNPDRFGLTYINTGLQILSIESQIHFAIPAELCIATSLGGFSLHVGAGGILHTGGEYLQPAIFYTFHGRFRVKFGKSPMFMEMEVRYLNSYSYYSNQRDGRAFSPGIGLSVGSYL